MFLLSTGVAIAGLDATMTTEAGVKAVLSEWGKYCRGSVYLGLPRQTLSEGMRSRGTVCAPVDAMPPDVEAVELAVKKLVRQHRAVLIRVYCHYGTMLEKARCLGLARRTLFRRLESAERAVAIEISY